MKAVLPLDPVLEESIFRNNDHTKKCIICNKAYISRSNNSKYCKKCAKEVINNQKANYIYKVRHSVEK